MKPSNALFTSVCAASALLLLVAIPVQCDAPDPQPARDAHYLVLDGPRWVRVAPTDTQPGQGESLTVAFNRNYIFLGTRPQGLYRYTRKTGKWQWIDSKLPSALDYGFNPRSILVSPYSQTTLYAGIELNGTYRSDDEGITWKSMRNGLSGFGLNGICLAIHPKDPKRIFLGTDNGIYRSDNGGEMWTKITNGLPKTYEGGCTPSCNTLGLLPGNTNVMFAVFQNTGPDQQSGVYRSLNGGITWAPCNNGIVRDPKRMAGDPYSKPVPNVPVDTMSGRYVAFAPDGKTVYCGTQGGLYRSTDIGNHWIRCAEDLHLTDISAIAIDPRRPKVVFAAANTDKVYGSYDGGKTWRCYSNGLRSGMEKGARGMTMNFSDAGKTYKVTMYRRIDQNLVEYLAFDPYQANCLYAGCTSGLYKLRIK